MKTEVIYQILGGVFYLLNKIFLSLGERMAKKIIWISVYRFLESLNIDKTKLKIWSWISLLIGIPFWLILFKIQNNSIALALEASAIPSIVIGLIFSVKGLNKKEPFWIKYVVIYSIVYGLHQSISYYNGINNEIQITEIIMVFTFLIGNYYLTKGKNTGYIYYILMHVSCIYLMYLNEYHGLMWQQLISIGFVVDAYIISKIKKLENGSV